MGWLTMGLVGNDWNNTMGTVGRVNTGFRELIRLRIEETKSAGEQMFLDF